MEFNFRNLLKKSIPYILAVLALSLALIIWMNTQQYRDLQNKQQELIQLNQQIVDNSTEWQRLEDLQKQLADSNSSLRSQRDQLEESIATQMGLGTGGSTTTPSTTIVS
jgi:cell division protein FtsL